VSEERVAFILRVEKIRGRETSNTFLAPVFFYLEDGGDTFLLNVGSYKINTAPYLKRRHSSDIFLIYLSGSLKRMGEKKNAFRNFGTQSRRSSKATQT
jgi:hypothetical protein